jgi:NAD-dependent deacetylase
MPPTGLQKDLPWLGAARSVTVLTGAGISTDSGIPDFRGPKGVWTKDPSAAAMFTIDNYVADPEVRRRAWRNRREHTAWTAEPNAGHAALVGLEAAGRLRSIVTQNIDGLHQKAGSDPEKVIEIHGTLWQAVCLSCANRTTMEETLARVDNGADDPACELCGGILKSATISFGQALEPEVLKAAVRAAQDCDLLLAVGSSLTVHPAAGLVDIARDQNARIVVINAQPTPYDALADAVIREPISFSLPAVVAAVKGGESDR